MNQRLDPKGLAFAFAAYGIWGFFPVLMAELRPAGPIEIAAHRALWSLAVAAIILLAWRRWGALWAVLRNRRAMLVLAVAAVLIAINWAVMLHAILTDHVSSAALGYYINPLITVGLGVFFLRENLHGAQKIAIGIGAVAVAVIGIGLGGIPWVSLTLAVSFALYSLVKTRVGASIDPVTGFTVETTILAPFALGVVWFIASSGQATWGAEGVGHDLWLASTGIWTAGALIIFAAGAARLPLSITGLIQYLAPTINFILAIVYFHEPMPPERWAGFALVWVALAVISVDSWKRSAGRADRRARRVSGPRASEPAQVVKPTEPI